MKTVDLGQGTFSVDQLIAFARSESVVIHCSDGTDFLLEEADEFEREAAALGGSASFTSLLRERSAETDASAADVARRLGLRT